MESVTAEEQATVKAQVKRNAWFIGIVVGIMSACLGAFLMNHFRSTDLNSQAIAVHTVQIKTVADSAAENKRQIERMNERMEKAIDKLEATMRESDSRTSQSLGEIRALIIQQSTKEK